MCQVLEKATHMPHIIPRTDHRNLARELDRFGAQLNQCSSSIGHLKDMNLYQKHVCCPKVFKIRSSPAVSIDVPSTCIFQKHERAFLEMALLSGFEPGQVLDGIQERCKAFDMLAEQLPVTRTPKESLVPDVCKTLWASVEEPNIGSEGSLRSPNLNQTFRGSSRALDKVSPSAARKAIVDRYLRKRRARLHLHRSSRVIAKFPERSALATQRRRIKGRFAKEDSRAVAHMVPSMSISVGL
mmetsp:Transcript_21920/g.37601  ORF Transcript_21920/g.37601 Transcript_21920/m.37601 type:complete len:241 (+) Transcript_21920:367-1089(+)